MPRIAALTLVLLFTVCLVAVPASARKAKDDKEVTDLTGVWKATTNSVVMGNTLHHDPAAAPAFRHIEMSMTIEKQEGAMFYGSWASPKTKETMVGVIDGATVYMADDDGVTIGKLLSKNKMLVKYLQPGKDAKVAAITMFTREKE